MHLNYSFIKNVHLKYSSIKKKRAKTFISNIFGPNSKRAPERSVQLKAMYLEALLYLQIAETFFEKKVLQKFYSPDLFEDVSFHV